MKVRCQALRRLKPGRRPTEEIDRCVFTHDIEALRNRLLDAERRRHVPARRHAGHSRIV
jgi:hypothetical protein